MFAGGMTFAIPEMMPEAVADEKLLYVSAENSLFGNVFAGAQVVEIIVRDPQRDETDEKQGEPTVEVNNEILRMVQGEDGYWYAYIMSTGAAATATANANIDLGTALTAGVGPAVCGATCRDSLDTTLSVSGTTTVYIDDSGTRTENNGRESAPSMSQWEVRNGSAFVTQQNNGQVNVTAAVWPFIQTWDFINDSDVTIVLEKAGADEVVELVFETGGTGMEDYAYIELDRSSAPAGAHVHMTIYDNQLNHDPTQEDSVAFLTNGTFGVSYNASKAFAAMSSGEFGDNGALKITLDAASSGTDVLSNQNNLDCVTDTISGANEREAFTGYHCFTETGSNTGIFTNGDDADTATMIVSTSALRGTTATIDYNDSAQSLLVTTSAGTIDMAEGDAGEEWNSGEAITVTLVDPDRNLNSGSDEDLTVATTDNVPTIKLGTPLGLLDGHDAGNMTMTNDDVTGITTFTLDTAQAALDATTPIWSFTSGLTHTDVNAMNTSMVQRYVAVDLSDFCTADTLNVAGKTDQTVKGVISYGTASLSDGGEDFSCDMTTGAKAVGATYTGTLDFMAFGPSDNHGIY